MNRALFGIGFAWVMACAVTVAAQGGARPDAAFEVASVKPNNRGERMIRIDTEGKRFIATNVPVRTGLRRAPHRRQHGPHRHLRFPGALARAVARH